MDDKATPGQNRHPSSTTSESTIPSSLLAAWTATQLEIASTVIPHDTSLPFRIPAAYSSSSPIPTPLRPNAALIFLGADISFSSPSPAAGPPSAVATLTAVRLLRDGSLRPIYSASRRVAVDVPYAPTFLAFREAPHVLRMLSAAPRALTAAAAALLLDGNGLLHPRGAGLACHVGVRAGMPTVGLGKTLMCVDGLVEREVRGKVRAAGKGVGVDLVGDSGRVWGKAILTGNAVNKPLFVSVGHRIGLETAVGVVKALCNYRVPEPVRLADLHSREALRGNFVEIKFDAASLANEDDLLPSK